MSFDFKELRKKALDALANNQALPEPDQWGNDIKKIIEELSIHQIELEYQNEELQRIETELRQSSAEIADLFEYSPAGQLIVDSGHVITNVNSTFAQMIAHEKEEIIGCEIETFIAPLYKDTFYHFFKSLQRDPSKSHIDLKVRSPRRSDIWARIDGVSEKGVSFFRLSVTDITMQKRMESQLRKETEKALLSETKFRQIVERSTDVFYYQDLPGRLINYISPNIVNIVGYTANECMSMKGEDILKLIYPDDREAYIKIVDTLLKAEADDKHSVTKEFRMCTKFDELKWIRGSYSILKDFEGTPKQILATLHDITNDRKLSDELTKQKDKAVSNDTMKSAFLANMSHEIRTPLNAIIGFASLMKDEYEEENNKENAKKLKYITIIENNGNTLLDLINDLICISKIEAKQMGIRIAPVDINRLMCNTYSSFVLEAEKKGLSLICTSNDPEPLMVSTDEDKLVSCVNNLVKNAIKYTEKGSITFGATVKRKKLYFQVSDTGIGIPEEKMETIFDRFSQVSLTKSSDGVGLGLNIVNSLVTLMKGKVSVESEVGKGSTFSFYIPIQ